MQRIVCGLIKGASPSALITLRLSFPSMGRMSKAGEGGTQIQRHWPPYLYPSHIKGDRPGVSVSPPLAASPGSDNKHSPGCTADLSRGLSARLKWNLAGLNQKSNRIRFALACVEVVVSHADMVAIKRVATGSYPRVQLCFVPCRSVGLCEFPHSFLSCRPWLFRVEPSRTIY